MSHSKGFLAGTCPGKMVKYRSASEGYQQYKCGRCGKVERRKVRPCFLFHSWEKVGAQNHGRQRYKCRRCDTRETRNGTSCFLFHSYHGCKKNRKPHCQKCNRTR